MGSEQQPIKEVAQHSDRPVMAVLKEESKVFVMGSGVAENQVIEKLIKQPVYVMGSGFEPTSNKSD